MKFTKKACIILGIMLFFVLCSCAKGENVLPVKLSPSNKSWVDLVSTIYDESQLTEIEEFQGKTIQDFHSNWPIEYIRVEEYNYDNLEGSYLEEYGIREDDIRENEYGYRVVYRGADCVCVIRFDKEGNHRPVLNDIYKTEVTRSDFGKLTEENFLNDVRAIDPNGDYLFLHTGRLLPRESHHFTTDGYLITIQYDDRLAIRNISEELL